LARLAGQCNELAGLEISDLGGTEEGIMAQINLSVKLPHLPRARANVYKLRQATVSEKAIRALARRLGMRAEATSGSLTSDATKLAYSERHFELTMFRNSGGFRLIDRSRWQVDDRQSDLNIDDAAARRLAASVIKKNRLAGANEIKILKVSRLRVGHAARDGQKASERTIDVAVAVQRQVDKLPVDGPGGKIVAYFDHERNLTGLEQVWREIAGVYRRSQPLKPPQGAIDEMAEHFRMKKGTIEIQEIRYGYFEDDWRNKQKYLQPAYVIFGMLGSPGSNVRKRTIYVASALAKPVARITPPLVKERPQEPRATA
jgi:hypothetical protein